MVRFRSSRRLSISRRRRRSTLRLSVDAAAAAAVFATVVFLNRLLLSAPPPAASPPEVVGPGALVRRGDDSGGDGGVRRRRGAAAGAGRAGNSSSAAEVAAVASAAIASVGAGAAAAGGYDEWRERAARLASRTPSEVLDELGRTDPFGVRTLDESLRKRESALGRVLTDDEVRDMFPCPPPEERISLPDKRDLSRAEAFRNAEPGTFLFFQHLRKAGGTNFCSLAEANLDRSARPPYYCMPDWEWSRHRTAGYLHHYSNEEIQRRMENDGYRIAGNEWDDFDPTRHFDLPAALATSFRSPLDRALSQFRFECVEDRGCMTKDVATFWAQRIDLHNVYCLTFADPPQGGGARASLRRAFRGASEDDGRRRAELVGGALDAVARFHVVLSMEWLAYAGPAVRDVLGFGDTAALTKRVRPHIGQARRDDGQERNVLGSAGIAKASWVPREYLSPEQYRVMSEDLALDEILTDAARRMFLERLVCPDPDA